MFFFQNHPFLEVQPVLKVFFIDRRSLDAENIVLTGSSCSIRHANPGNHPVGMSEDTGTVQKSIKS